MSENTIERMETENTTTDATTVEVVAKKKFTLPKLTPQIVAHEAWEIAKDCGKTLFTTAKYVSAGLVILNGYSYIMSHGKKRTNPVPRIEVRIHDASAGAHDVDVMYDGKVADVKCVGAFGEEFSQMTQDEVKASDVQVKTELEAFEAAQKPADEAIAE